MSATATSTAAEPKKRMAGWGCWLIGTAAILVVLVLAIAVRQIVMARQVEAELARLRAEGKPTTPEELDAFYEYPPPEEDATELWREGMKRLVVKGFRITDFQGASAANTTKDWPPKFDEPWPELPQVRDALAKNREAMELFHAAAGKGGRARYQVKFEDGMNAKLPDAENTRTVAKWLELECLVRARDGDARGAAESLHAMLCAGRSLKGEPVLVSQILRAAVFGMVREQLEDLLSRLKFSSDDLQRIRAQFHDTEWRASLARSLEGERVMALQDARESKGRDQSAESPLAIFYHDDVLLYLELFRRMDDAIEGNWVEVLDNAEQIEQYRDAVLEKAPLAKYRFRFALTYGSYLYNAAQMAAQREAICATADTAIGVELFRRKHGRLPAKLEELVPEFLPAVPLDPFDDQPLRYVVREDEYVVYSVGVNRIDEGGKEAENWIDEIPFRVRRGKAAAKR